jgi:hypothetical protein
MKGSGHSLFLDIPAQYRIGGAIIFTQRPDRALSKRQQAEEPRQNDSAFKKS